LENRGNISEQVKNRQFCKQLVNVSKFFENHPIMYELLL
jgi:hypothetical protein